MSNLVSSPKNVVYVNGGQTYNVSALDDVINVNSTLGATEIVLPNIVNQGLDFYPKKFTINDTGGAAGTNPITISAVGNQVNSGASTILNRNNVSSEVVIVSKTEYLVNTDNGGSTGIFGSGTVGQLAYFSAATVIGSLTNTQATALLDNFVGDSGSGGLKGLVPAPIIGDAAANKYLKADGTWNAISFAGYLKADGTVPLTANWDVGAFEVTAQSLKIDGTGGNGHFHLRYQSAIPTGAANNSKLFSGATGALGWVVDSNAYAFYLDMTGNTASRTLTVPNASGTIALTTDIVNLGNSNLTSTDNERYFRLNGTTSSNFLKFRNSSDISILSLFGDKSIVFGNSGNPVSINFNIDASDATGDTWYRNSGGLMARLGIGTSGQVLTVAAGLPSWATLTVNNLGNSNLTSTDDARTFTLKSGTTASQNLQFLNNGGGNLLALKGNNTLDFGSSANYVNSNFYCNPATNTNFNILRGTDVYIQSDVAAYATYFRGSSWSNLITLTHDAGQITVQGASAGFVTNNLVLRNDSTVNSFFTMSAAGVQTVRFDSPNNNFLMKDTRIGGVYTDPILAKFTVKGNGSTSATTTALFQNSASTNIFKVLDNGNTILNLPSTVAADSDIFNNGVNLYTDGTSLKARYKNNSGTSSDLLVGSNLGNANLTSTDDARTFTLKSGGTATQNLQFLNDGGGNLLTLYGNRNIEFGSSSSLLTEFLMNLSGTGSNFRIAVGATAYALYYDAPAFNLRIASNTSNKVEIYGNLGQIQTFGSSSSGFYLSKTSGLSQGALYVNNGSNLYMNNDAGTRLVNIESVNGFGHIVGGWAVGLAYSTAPSARLHTKGSGSTSATTTALFQNSSSAKSLEILDSGDINIYNSGGFKTAYLNTAGGGVFGGNNNGTIGANPNNIITGGYSNGIIIGGYNNTCNGYQNLAAGGFHNMTAAAEWSYAFGVGHTISKTACGAFGGAGHIVSGNYAAVLGGEQNTASGIGSIALGGNQVTASGLRSLTQGYGSSASGDYSITMGSYCAANARSSRAVGEFCVASGVSSWVSGLGTNYGGTNQELKASGLVSFNHSYNDGTILYLAAEGNYSAILGGKNQWIKTGAESSAIIGGSTNIINASVLRSVILGGTAITATVNDTAYALNVAIGTGSPTARLEVKGSASTSATTTALFQNSSSVASLKIRDDNYVIQRAINAAIADADLANNEMSAYINEATNFLIFKVKYSSGAIKTVSLALI